jgi:prepilin-type N-terminal cleavage/methylation domain-containing protein
MKLVAVRTQRGFTLIELAVVLTIIALVIGMSADMSISVIATMRLTATQKKMKTINDALMQFRTATDRLPCPGDLTLAPGAANYGIEAANPGTCTGGTPATNHTGNGATNTSATAAEGALPAVTLGLSPDFMLDGWGNKFRYAVDIAYTAKGVFATVGAGCTNGAITVKDGNGNARSTGSIYALISHGPNGHGAYTPSGATVNAGSNSADELTNCHCNSSGVYNSAYAPGYVQKLPAYDTGETGNALYYYDDLVSYKERWQMRADWDKAGGCPYIYVTDQSNNRVEKFDMSGNFVAAFGSSSLSNPSYLAVDSSGNVFVDSYSNDQVVKFNSSGNYVTEWGGWGNISYPAGIAIDSSGNVWVADLAGHQIDELDNNLNLLKQFPDGGASGNGIAFIANGNFWVADSNSSTAMEFTTGGTKVAQTAANWNNFYGMATDASGNIWGMSGYLSFVTEYSVGGTLLTTIGGAGSSNGQLCINSSDVKIDSNGNVWVADSCNNRVQEFTSAGTWVRSIGGPSPYTCETSPAGSSPACAAGTGNGQFNYPVGIAFGSR